MRKSSLYLFLLTTFFGAFIGLISPKLPYVDWVMGSFSEILLWDMGVFGLMIMGCFLPGWGLGFWAYSLACFIYHIRAGNMGLIDLIWYMPYRVGGLALGAYASIEGTRLIWGERGRGAEVGKAIGLGFVSILAGDVLQGWFNNIQPVAEPIIVQVRDGLAFSLGILMASSGTLEFWERILGQEASYPGPMEGLMLRTFKDVFVLDLMTGIWEEILFRYLGVIFLSRIIGFMPALLISSFLFGLVHYNYGIAKVPSGFAVGMAFGILAYRLGIWSAIASHAFLDFYIEITSLALEERGKAFGV